MPRRRRAASRRRHRQRDVTGATSRRGRRGGRGRRPLVDGLAPGDVVVADRVLDERGQTVPAHLDGAPLVAAALRRRGLTVRVGPIVSTPHLVKGPERAPAWPQLGALAVDMETLRLAGRALGQLRSRSSGPSPTPRHPRASVARHHPGRMAGARSRSGRPRPCSRNGPPRSARGVYCWPGRDRSAPASNGPSRRSSGLSNASARPVYVRRQIVHNRHVVSGPGGAGRRLRARARRGARRGHSGLLRPRRGPGGARRSRRGEACRSSTPPAPWWPRSTTRCSASRLAATRSCSSATPATTRPKAPSARAPASPWWRTPPTSPPCRWTTRERLAYVTQTTLSPDDVVRPGRPAVGALPGHRRAARRRRLLRHPEPPGRGAGHGRATATCCSSSDRANSSNTAPAGGGRGAGRLPGRADRRRERAAPRMATGRGHRRA